MSGANPCKDIDLQSRITVEELLAENTGGVWVNDVWGWTDPVSGIEYALVAMSNGTSFVDISDPINPVVLGILPEHASAVSGRSAGSNSIWRDVKVFDNHAFIVSEDPNHGMQVFDLTNLRNVQNPPVTFPESAHYSGVSNAHNIVINEETGFAYIVGATRGSTCSGGGLHIVDINDPINPKYAGCFDTDGYTHDAQCVIYTGPDTDYTNQEICFSSNDQILSLSNVTDKSNSYSIVTRTYAGVEYAHQGWLSEDQKFFFSNDELDELNTGKNTRTFVWNVEDLDDPVLISTFIHSGNTIDHNLYCRDTLIYESNYTSGLRILNYKNVATTGLEEVAFFDTYQQNNETSFEGSWSNYPYFESNNILVTDVINGLFILKYNPQNQTKNDQTVASLNNDFERSLKLFPNPASNRFTLSFPELTHSKIDVDVYDFSGKKVLVNNHNLLESQEIHFNSSNLQKGLYHIRVTVGKNRVTKKILIN